MDGLRIGIAGSGNIANALYLPGISNIPRAEVVALCDILPERSDQTRARFGIDQVYADLDDMLAKADLDILLNTTPIQTHYEVNLKALEAGVHVYTEKTMASSVEEADHLIELARSQEVMLACAPDTMAWPYAARLRELVGNGAAGKATWAKARGSHGGPELELPTDVRWFYQPGAGPLRDMGVYALDLMAGLLGPAERVSALSTISRPVRHVPRGPFEGTEVPVEVDDNVLILLDFGQGVLGFVDSGFCTVETRAPELEIYGTAGTLSARGTYMIPDGSTTIELYRDDARDQGWTIAYERLGEPRTRAMGLAHMVDCLLDGAELVLTPERARHVVEIIDKAVEATRTGQTMKLETTF
jgi:predicted dehydrogenase